MLSPPTKIPSNPNTHPRRQVRLELAAARLAIKTGLVGRWTLGFLTAALIGSLSFSGPGFALSNDPLDACAVQVRVLSAGQAIEGAKWTVPGTDASPMSDERGVLCAATATDLIAGRASQGLNSKSQKGNDAIHALVIAEGFVVARARVPLSAAKARQNENPAQPLEVVVELQPAFGEEMVVSASRYQRRLLEVPVHIQRVGREAIAASSSRTLADAVEYAAGVRVESNCQNCNFSQVRMLGLEGPYSQILVDGQPSLSSLALVYGIEQIPAASLDSIEITKGGGSALYGAGAVGGTINLIPRSVDHTGLHAELTQVETGGEPGTSVMGFGEVTGGERAHGVTVLLQYDQLDAADLDGDGFSEVTSRELENANVRYQGLFLGNTGQLAIDVNRTDSYRRGGDLDFFDLAPDQTRLTEAIGTKRTASTARWLHQLSSQFDLRLAGSFSTTERDSYYGADFDPDAYGTTEGEVLLGDLQMNRYFDKSTLTFGTQFIRDTTIDSQPAYNRFIDETFDTTSLFVQEDRKVGNGLTVLYGLRVDDHTAVADPVLSPRASALWAPTSQVSVRASVSQGFRAPATFDEDLHIELVGGGRARVVRRDPGLSEERSLATVLSAEWKPSFGARGTAAFEVALFRTKLDDLFFNLDDDDPSTPDALELLTTNLGDATVRGIELAAAYRFNSRFFAEAAIVEQSARFGEPEPDFMSRDFFRTPERYGSLNVQAQLPGELDLFVGALYTGSMKAPHYAGFIDSDRLETTPTFLTFSLGLSRTFQLGDSRELKLGIAAKNLTDEYQEDLDQGPARDSSYVYGPRLPRSLSLTIGLEL